MISQMVKELLCWPTNTPTNWHCWKQHTLLCYHYTGDNHMSISICLFTI